MSSSDVRIIVNAIDNASGKLSNVDKALKKLGISAKDAKDFLAGAGVDLGLIENPAMAAGKAVGWLGKQLKQGMDKYIALVDEVRQSSATWGTSAEDTSRLIEVFGDLGVSAETLSSAFAIASKNGFIPSIDNLAALADKAKALQDPTERAALLSETFGRGWKEVWPVLAEGGNYLKDMAGSIGDVKVITEDSIVAIKNYKLQLENLNDAGEELGMTAGKNIVPKLTEMANNLNTLLGLGDRFANDFIEGNAALLKNARNYEYYVKIQNEHIDVLKSIGFNFKWAEKSVEGFADAVRVLSEAEFIAAQREGYWLENIEQAYDARDYLIQATKESTTTTEADTIALERQAAALKACLDAGLNGTIQKSWDDYTTAVAKADGSAGSALATFQNVTKELIYQQAAANMDSEAALNLARQMGLISETDYNAAQLVADLTEKYDLNKDGMISAAEGAAGYNASMLLLNQALADGKLTAAEIQKILDYMNGKSFTADFNVTGNWPVIPGVASSYSGDGWQPGKESDEDAPGSSFASGGSFIIPPGYPNDSYPLGGNHWAQSGEQVVVVPKNQTTFNNNIYTNQSAQSLFSFFELQRRARARL